MNFEAIIAQQASQIVDLTQSYESYKKSAESYKESTQEEIYNLKHQILMLQKLIYGRKSERYIPDLSNQPNLFSSIEEVLSAVNDVILVGEQTKEVTYERKKTNQKGRQLLSNCGHLPVEETILNVEGSEDMKKIGEEVSEKLAYKPGRLYRKQIIRPKYVNDEGQICIAEMPETAIPKCEADTSLLSYVITSKFVDHIPEHRQQQILKREGVIIPPSTMNGWVHQVAGLMKLVANQILKEVLSSGYIQMDESTIKVLFEKKGTTHRGYMWVTVDPQTKNVYYEYHEGRGREGPKLLLKDYKGKVQSDGYNVYEHLDILYEDIDFYCCWAHARRKFVEAESNDKRRSQQILQFIQELYQIEADCRQNDMSYEQRYQLRQQRAVPILETIKGWLDKESLLVTPKSTIGQAISYTLVRWNKLLAYSNTGEVEIDNNLVENAIRPLALGRKNYLFAGGHDAACNIAYIYTVLNTCKALDINQYQYLTWYLEQLPNIKMKDIASYTPSAYKKLMADLQN